jgi:RHS repeat-associated protein
MTWGQDLSQSLQGAGGVGGLVMTEELPPGGGAPVPSFPTYDGNGNITAWVNASGTVTARQRYDAFGNIIEQTGTAPSRYGFSTKPIELVTGFLYYGYRYYDPATGRWPSRDPIEESGGMNLYGFVYNDAQNWIDNNGRSAMSWALPAGGGLALADSPFLPFGDAAALILITGAAIYDAATSTPTAPATPAPAPPGIPAPATPPRTLDNSGDYTIDQIINPGIDQVVEDIKPTPRLEIPFIVYHYGVCGKLFLMPGEWVTTVGGLSWSEAIQITFLENLTSSGTCSICEYTALIQLEDVRWGPMLRPNFPQGILVNFAFPISVRPIDRP